ncbi:hypothetical protein Micbo1qcDRAFT_107376, partial [Microdochium bolleyi]
ESRKGPFLAQLLLCTILGAITVALRIYTRSALIKKRFADDYCIILGLTSILLQYVRISVLSIEKRICYGILAFVVASGVTWIIVLYFECIPFSAEWNLDTPGARCVNRIATYYAASVTTILADVIILVIPVFLLRHSTLQWYKKMVIGIILAFGGLGCIGGILRVRAIALAIVSADPSWDSIPNASLAAVEVNLGIICSSVVTLGPLFKQ